MSANQISLGEILDLAVKYNLRRIRAGTIEAEFFAPAQGAQGSPIPTEPDNCPCGHDWAEHNETGCLRGCDMKKCEPEAKS